MKRLPPNVERTVAGCLLCAMFILMASVFAPDFSQAGTDGLAPNDPHAGLTSLGVIMNQSYQVEIYGSPDGPLYTIFDVSGRPLAALLTAEQAAEEFPDLPIPAMDFGTNAPLSLVMPGDQS